MKNKYDRPIKSKTDGEIIIADVYSILKAFDVKNPATQHAIKKLLASGQRGYKDIIQDLEEAKDSILRAIELEE